MTILSKEFILELISRTVEFTKEEYPNVKFFQPNVVWIKDNSSAGMYDPRTNEIKLNERFINVTGEAIETAIHEVAHWAVHWIWDGRRLKPHGVEWKNLMTLYGYPNAKATFNEDNPMAKATNNKVRRQRRWEYSCNCTEKHEVATVTHNRIQKGQSRHCNDCKATIVFTGKEIK